MARRQRVRKNIREDQLVTWTVRLSRWVSDHFNVVVAGAVALVVVIGATVFVTNSRRAAERDASQKVSAAMAMIQRGEYSAARSTLGQVVRDNGGRAAAMALYFRAEASLRMGDYSAALQDFDAYLERADDFPEMKTAALYGRAVCQEGLGDARKAAEAFMAFLDAADPDDPRYARAAYEAGEAWRRAGETDRALEAYRLAVAHATGALREQAQVAVDLLGG